MNAQQIELLRFRRQYLLSPMELACPFQNKRYSLGTSLFLYAHTELEVSIRKEQDLSLILLGNLFDADSPARTNMQILNDFNIQSFDNILRQLSVYTGNFVLIFQSGEHLRLAHDATANKKVYYCSKEGKNWCASNPHLLARICGFQMSADPSRVSYYDSEVFREADHASVGYTTCYEEVSQLLPNFSLDLSTLSVNRYWPLEERHPISLDECADRCAHMIKGYMDSILSRFDVMLPVTAGKDSRTLLATCKEHQDKVFYYINRNSDMDAGHYDIQVPDELLKRLGLKYNILEINNELDEDFIKIYFENNPLASPSILPTIYNYYLHFEDRVNLPANAPSNASWRYPNLKNKYDPEIFLRIHGVSSFPHAARAYEWWHEHTKEYTSQSGYNIFDLFFWEERMGNWGAQYMQEKEIAQEEFNVFNSRLLSETIISVKSKHTLKNGSFILHSAIINRLWPEVLQLPINPSSLQRKMLILEKVGLIKPVYWLYAKGYLRKF